MEVEMKIRGLMMDPVTNMRIVVLKDVQGQAILPMWVGVYEANAIGLEIEKVQTPRPMTHDLLKNVLLGLEVRVQKIVVNDLKGDTFYALIWVEREGQMMTIDSRPGDALALALRMDCPIFVEDEVLKNSKISSAISERTTNEQLRSWLEGLSDDDLGRYKMYRCGLPNAEPLANSAPHSQSLTCSPFRARRVATLSRYESERSLS